VDLARRFNADPGLERWLEDPANGDDAVFAALLDLPGIGPYAAGNIMQLLGRYSRLALDTESLRHARSVLGMRGDDARLFKRLHKHYEPFGEHRFRSYWFELWDDYERKRGPAWTWDPATTGKTFTAALLEPKPPRKKRPARRAQGSGKSSSSRKRSVSQT
jgi:3-methyladenine DNA glycosylase/8-oxoguanine DNA glycosylase